jgi:RNA recognition motif. (a.k.a. RRM, RBD, or RNP domain)
VVTLHDVSMDRVIEHPSPALRIFVGRLGPDATEAEVHAAFALVGISLARIELVMSHATHASRGFAFVALADPSGDGAPTTAVLEQMRRAVVRERAVEVYALRMPARRMGNGDRP